MAADLLNTDLCSTTLLTCVDLKTHQTYTWEKVDRRMACDRHGAEMIHEKFEPYLGRTFFLVQIPTSNRDDYRRIKTQGQGGITVLFKDRTRYMFTASPTNGSSKVDGMEASRLSRQHHVRMSWASQVRYMSPLKAVKKPRSNRVIRFPDVYSKREIDAAFALLGWDLGRFPMEKPDSEVIDAVTEVIDYSLRGREFDLLNG